MVKRIELLVEAIAHNPELVIGKPEQLKHKFSGYWSRRINI
jgi:toxin YoeB